MCERVSEEERAIGVGEGELGVGSVGDLAGEVAGETEVFVRDGEAGGVRKVELGGEDTERVFGSGRDFAGGKLEDLL